MNASRRPPHLLSNWLRVSLESKRDVKKRCSVGVQERFESCEKGDSYAILSIACQDYRLNGHDDGAVRHRHGVRTSADGQK
jgi:hypothetical protein